jgi:hypothetical protein
MIVNFRARGISRGACKLAQTPMLIYNNNNNNNNKLLIKIQLNSVFYN